MSEISQRYISKELSHFVGRGCPQQTQYELLVNILRSGLLTYSPEEPNKIYAEILVRSDAKISENELYCPGMVCFCDIPVQDLTIHMRKYSSFGLAFSKDFVVRQGGAPVYYLPKRARLRIPKRLSAERMGQLAEKNLRVGKASIEREEKDWETTTMGEHFDNMLQIYDNVIRLFSKLINKTSALRDGEENLRHLYDLTDLRLFLDFHLFSFLKFFDHALLDHDPENYYFEREWRIVGSLQFCADDILRVFMPKEYGKRFRKDCPDYYGQITYADI